MRPALSFLSVLLLLVLWPAAARAQSSQFGVRGLGFPGREASVRVAGTGGAFALFDQESSQNPASLLGVATVTSSFTVTRSFRQVENPAGSASVQDTRFPQFIVNGPIRRYPAALGLSFSNYTSRDFTLASSETIDVRGEQVSVSDTFSSRGGLSDLRFASAFRMNRRWGVGAGFHIITGTNRLTSTRIFNDPDFLSSRQKAELSGTGVGVSLGLMGQFGAKFAVAAVARSDGHVNLDLDSTKIGPVDLPYTFGLGMRWRPAASLDLAAHSIVRTWSGANSDLLALGGVGARNTVELAAGGEYAYDPKRPYNRPLRFGARYATLPFPLLPESEQGHEISVSVGSGMRLAQQRAGIDVAVEYAWRSEGPYKENGVLVWLGVSVRP